MKRRLPSILQRWPVRFVGFFAGEERRGVHIISNSWDLTNWTSLNHLQLLLLMFKIFPSLASSYWPLTSSDMTSVVLTSFLLSSMTQYTKFILYISCPWSGLICPNLISVRSLGSFKWEVVYGNLSLSTCHWVGHYF